MGRNKREGRKFGLAEQHLAQIQKPRLRPLPANTFRNLATCISFIIWVTQQKYQLFAGLRLFLLEKSESVNIHVQNLQKLMIEIFQNNEQLEPLIYLGIPRKKGCEIRLTNKKFMSIAKNTNNKIWS